MDQTILQVFVEQSALPASPPLFHHFAYPPPPHVIQPPMNFAALAANSTELRRRAAQSARDKCHHKCSTNLQRRERSMGEHEAREQIG